MSAQPKVYRFGEFSLEVSERRLMHGEQEVPLSPKTFDTMLFLVERHGHLVTKEELLDAVWKEVAVTENAMTRCIKEIRKALSDDVQNPQFIKTIPKIGFRFIHEVNSGNSHGEEDFYPEEFNEVRVVETEITAEITGDDYQKKEIPIPLEGESLLALEQPRVILSRRKRFFYIAGAAILLILVSTAFYLYHRVARPGFSERDWVLIADFENSTGEKVLGSGLRAAIENELTRSKYLNVVPLSRILDTLRLMKSPPDTPITEQVGQEICLRDGGIRILLTGSMQQLGGVYQIGIKIIDPSTGLIVATENEQSTSQAQLLPAIGRLAAKIRKVLGESRDSIAPSNFRADQVTTASLEALDFFWKGKKFEGQFDWEQAAFNYSQAIERDPHFTLAYYARGNSSLYMWYKPGESVKGQADLNRAAELAERENTSLREKLLIQSRQALYCQGDLPHALEIGELLAQQFPDAVDAHANLYFAYLSANDWERCEQQYAHLLRLLPNSPGVHGGYAWFLFKFKGDLEKAARESQRTLELDSRFPLETVYIASPFAHLARGEFEEAEKETNAIFETQLSKISLAFQIPLRRYMAVIYCHLGNYEMARQLLETKVKWPVQFPVETLYSMSLSLRAAIHEFLNDHEKSRQLLKLDAENAIGEDRIIHLAQLGCEAARNGDFAEVGRLKNAMWMVKRPEYVSFEDPPLPHKLERAKKYWNALLDGEVALKKGQQNLSLACFEECLRQINSDSPGFDLNALPAFLKVNQALAKAYETRGHWDKAITCLESILNKKNHLIKDPWDMRDYEAALQSIIPLLEKSGRTKDAAKYRTAIDHLRPMVH